MKFNPHLAVPGLLLALSLPLSLSKNPAAMFSGLASAVGALSYGSASFLQREREHKLRQDIGRAKLAIDADRAQLDNRSNSYKRDMQFKLNKAVSELEATRLERSRDKADHAAEIKALESAKEAAIASAAGKQSNALRQQIQAEYDAKLATKADEFAEREAQFYTVEDDLINQVEKFQERHRQDIARRREEWSAEVNDRNSGWADNYRQLQSEVANYGDAFGVIRKEALSEVQQKDLKIAELAGVVKALRAANKDLKYRRFDVVGTDNVRANRLIDFMAKQGAIYAAFDHTREGHNGRLKVLLEPLDATLKTAQDGLEDMQAALGLHAKPSVKVDRAMHVFTLATEPEHKTEKVLSANIDRLKKSFDLANHIRLVGASGSGKSTFLDNLIWLGLLVWPTAKFTLLDPKAPFTEWTGGIVPDHKNLDCVEAIKGISQELQNRFQAANKIAETYGNNSPEFEAYVSELPYQLFVLDEAQYLYRDAKANDKKDKGLRANTVRDSLLDCLGVGRALKVKGYFITQSAKCSKIGMNEDDFDNATSIFLGGAITNALEGELKGSYSKAKIDFIASEYSTRRAKNQQYLGLVSDVDRDDLYLIELPQPGHFHQAFLTAKPCHATKTKNPASTDTQGDEPCQSKNTSGDSSALASPRAVCPKCSATSDNLRDATVTKAGKRRFYCDNSDCSQKTFSAKPI